MSTINYTESFRQTREQLRAKYAWRCVQRILKSSESEKYKKGYGQTAKSAPVDLLCNGLGQTVAFWYAKGQTKESKYYTQILRDLEGWIKISLGFPQDDLLKWIGDQADIEQYWLATAEAMAMLKWLKRFAEAKFPKQ